MCEYEQKVLDLSLRLARPSFALLILRLLVHLAKRYQFQPLRKQFFSCCLFEIKYLIFKLATG